MDKVTKILLGITIILLSFLFTITLIYFIDLSILTRLHPILIVLISFFICILIINYKILDSIQYDNFPDEKIEKEQELENLWIKLLDWYYICMVNKVRNT